MQCPVCDERLREVERTGVMIDICPRCKGIWLDRGELEKILEIAEQDGASVDTHETDLEDRHNRHEESLHDRDRKDDHHAHDRRATDPRGRPRRRGSWLSDIFEGFGGD